MSEKNLVMVDQLLKQLDSAKSEEQKKAMLAQVLKNSFTQGVQNMQAKIVELVEAVKVE